MHNFTKLTIISEKLQNLFKKADNHSTFYSSQQSFILFEKNRKKSNKKKIEKKKKKSRTIFFLLIFRNFPKKSAKGGHRQHCQRPQSVFEDETEEAPEKKIKNK